jgi:PAS domain-containing protein
VTPSLESWIESIYPEDRARVEAEFAQAVAGCGVQRIEFRIQREGKVRWFHSEGYVMCDPGGRPIRVAGVTCSLRATRGETLHKFVETLDG